MGGRLARQIRAAAFVAMTDHAAEDESAFIKANAPGFTRKIIRPANALAIRHDGNMAKALTSPFHLISRNKHIVLDAEGGKPTLHTRNEIASARTLRLINRVRQPNGRNAPQSARLGIDVNDMNPLGMLVIRVATYKANHPISPARKARRRP